MASHELRTPLTALSLRAETLRRCLRRSPAADEDAQRQLSAIDDQTRRLEGLIGLLLDVSRINVGRFTLDLSTFDLAEVAREVAERLKPDADLAGAELRLSTRLVIGRWDRMRLDQVVTNLVGNAIKYGPCHPVDVTVGERDGAAVVEVRDRGIGIPPESHRRIFERFERAGNVSAFRGLGLGLWIAKRLVEAHGGVISVESAPGAGSTFTVSLPRTPRTQAAGEQSEAAG
jgi:signal transduction histidine kinase